MRNLSWTFGDANNLPFADFVAAWMVNGDTVREGLVYEGRNIVYRLCVGGRFSLRQLAAKAELSPTYLSVVLNGKAIISPEAFLRLCKIEKEESQ